MLPAALLVFKMYYYLEKYVYLVKNLLAILTVLKFTTKCCSDEKGGESRAMKEASTEQRACTLANKDFFDLVTKGLALAWTLVCLIYGSGLKFWSSSQLQSGWQNLARMQEEPRTKIETHWTTTDFNDWATKVMAVVYVCFPLLILRSEMFPSRRRYHLTTICPRDTYGSHLGLTWLSPKNII